MSTIYKDLRKTTGTHNGPLQGIWWLHMKSNNQKRTASTRICVSGQWPYHIRKSGLSRDL